MKTKTAIKSIFIGKTVAFAILFSVLNTSCNFLNSKIDGEKVNVDDSTKIYTYIDGGKKVTGTVIFHETSSLTSKKFKQAVREVKEGKRVKKGYDYFESGNVNAEYPYDKNGFITGTVKFYFPNGKVASTTEFKENKENGVQKEYREDGTQRKETVFKEGIKTKEYDFDESGKKIIPAIERLELVAIKTGFYEYIDNNSNQLLYLPMVIMKWKNKSDQQITESIEIDGVFINNSNMEEMAKTTEYFQGYSDSPLQPNLSRQCFLQSSVGYPNASSIYGINISCQIIVNKQLFKIVKIKNVFLSTNRI